jgi:outer membrane protein assembly factor BamC
MYNRVYLLSLVVLLSIAGCSSDGDERRQKYLDADYYTRLELPPDLTSPEESKQLTSPQPTPEAMEQFKRDSADVGKFTPNVAPILVGISVSGARIQENDGIYWLEIDEPADKLWPQLSGFWSNEGIEIVRREPLLGFMETDWSSQLYLEENAGWLAKVFNQFEPTKLDKFRMRVEPEPDVNKTRVFISHTGRERVVEGDDSNWVIRGSDPELEHEMLTRLALYVGVDGQQLTEVFAGYKPFSSRVKASQGDAYTFYVPGTVETNWPRVLRAVDRANIFLLEEDESTQQIKVAVGKISMEQLGEEADELTESSWLAQWFSGSSDEDYKTDSDRQFNIQLTQNGDAVRIDILKSNNEPAEGVLAEQLRKSLMLELN